MSTERSGATSRPESGDDRPGGRPRDSNRSGRSGRAEERRGNGSTPGVRAARPFSVAQGRASARVTAPASAQMTRWTPRARRDRGAAPQRSGRGSARRRAPSLNPATVRRAHPDQGADRAVPAERTREAPRLGRTGARARRVGVGDRDDRARGRLFGAGEWHVRLRLGFRLRFRLGLGLRFGLRLGSGSGSGDSGGHGGSNDD